MGIRIADDIELVNWLTFSEGGDKIKCCKRVPDVDELTEAITGRGYFPPHGYLTVLFGSRIHSFGTTNERRWDSLSGWTKE